VWLAGACARGHESGSECCRRCPHLPDAAGSCRQTRLAAPPYGRARMQALRSCVAAGCPAGRLCPARRPDADVGHAVRRRRRLQLQRVAQPSFCRAARAGTRALARAHGPSNPGVARPPDGAPRGRARARARRAACRLLAPARRRSAAVSGPALRLTDVRHGTKWRRCIRRTPTLWVNPHTTPAHAG
jgi:hypothetical protein